MGLVAYTHGEADCCYPLRHLALGGGFGNMSGYFGRRYHDSLNSEYG